MLIHTTMYIKANLLKEVNDAVAVLQIKKSHLVSLIISKVMADECITIKMMSQVKYQRSDSETKWKRIHVVLPESIYENCLDMRKLCKMSVSYILACAISKYLKKIIIDHLIKREHNNTYSDHYSLNYLFLSRVEEGLFHFTVFWGFPDKRTLKYFFK